MALVLPRRKFLAGLAAAFAAPAIVKASSLMPVKVMERDFTIYVDHHKPNAFRTIQSAIDYVHDLYPFGNATATIQIGSGVYEGPIRADLRMNLLVRGTGDETNIVTPMGQPTLQAYNESILKIEKMTFEGPRSRTEDLLTSTTYLFAGARS